jgi:hypothetical protein
MCLLIHGMTIRAIALDLKKAGMKIIIFTRRLTMFGGQVRSPLSHHGAFLFMLTYALIHSLKFYLVDLLTVILNLQKVR